MNSRVTVSTAASSRLMCKVADVQAEPGMSGFTSAQVTRQIIAAGRSAAAVLQREPWLETVTENLAGRGGSYLKLSRWPVMTVSSVTEGLAGDNPTTIAASEYSISGARRDRLYREDGWSWHQKTAPTSYSDVDGPSFGYNVSYVGGWVMPDQITAWSAAASVTSGQWYSTASDTDNPFIFRAGGAGTTDSTEPTWPTSVGSTVTDNDITWTAYSQRIPEDVEVAMVLLVASWLRGGLDVPTGIRREKHGPHEVEYWESGANAISSSVMSVLRRYR